MRQGGEWPAVHLPKLAVLLIGTNDLSNADCTQTEDALLAAVPGVLTRMNGVLGAISNAPHIAIVGLLPRGAAFWEREQQWVYPNRYTNAVQYVNQGFAVRPAPSLPWPSPHSCDRSVTRRLPSLSPPPCHAVRQLLSATPCYPAFNLSDGMLSSAIPTVSGSAFHKSVLLTTCAINCFG